MHCPTESRGHYLANFSIKLIFAIPINFEQMKTLLPFVGLVALLSSCGSNRQIEYNHVEANLPEVTKTLTIASWDQRPQILDGRFKPDFVGYLRSSAGIPYAMGTESDQTLMEDISESISLSFKNQNSLTKVVTTSPSDSKESILTKLKEEGGDRLVLLTCDLYHTDGYGKMFLEYDVTLEIFNTQAKLLASKEMEGKRHVGGSVWYGGKFKQYIPEGLKTLLEELFNDPIIVAALQGNPLSNSPLASKSIAELEEMEKTAVAEQNYMLAKEIKDELTLRQSTEELVSQKESEMKKAAEEGDYEKAAELKAEVEKLKAVTP